MEDEYNLKIMASLKEKMDDYKSKLTDKYNRTHSRSKRTILAKELIYFSGLYRDIFGTDNKFDWDNDIKIYDNFDDKEIKEFKRFVEYTNENNDFFYQLSKSVINSYDNVQYPFYKYFTNKVLINPRLDRNTMINLMLSFLKSYDYDTFIDMKDKIFNLELLQLDFEALFSGLTYPISSLNKNFILLNNNFEDNLYKYSTIIHEYGHTYEMKLFQNSCNNILLEKTLETPYFEVSSCFFEYAFLNYLKENKIYTTYVNHCLDNYYKEIITHFFQMNLISKFPDLEIEEDETIAFESKEIIKYGDKIKNRLNYYEFIEYDEPVDFRYPYIYGIGKLLSIYLYENYKTNPNFFNEFNKSLLSYPLINDISAFCNLGITKEELLKGDTLRKVLKKHSKDFLNDV